MKYVSSLSIFVLFFFFATAQKSASGTFVKLVSSSGQQIIGDNAERGYERWIVANTITTSGKKNEIVSFTLNIIGAAADLKKVLTNGDVLQSAEIDVMRPMNADGRRLPAYVIKMESIKIVSCTESVGCNGAQATNVTLQAGRIGWVYYDANKPTLAVTNKYGYDVAKGVDWTVF